MDINNFEKNNDNNTNENNKNLNNEEEICFKLRPELISDCLLSNEMNNFDKNINENNKKEDELLNNEICSLQLSRINTEQKIENDEIFSEINLKPAELQIKN